MSKENSNAEIVVALPARNCIKQPCGAVSMEVEHPEYGWIPYHATAGSGGFSELMYNKAHLGDFGKFVEAPAPSTKELAANARAERDYLLTVIDAFVSNPLRWAELSSSEQAAIGAYRTHLLNVPQQAGFPKVIEWGTKPDTLI